MKFEIVYFIFASVGSLLYDTFSGRLVYVRYIKIEKFWGEIGKYRE
jgi:hypothetical protein